MVRVISRLLPIGAFFVATCFASAALADGEVWVGKGPRVVSDSGEALASATAFSKPDVNDDGGYTLFDAIPVDEDGRLVLNRFISGALKVDLFCRGHYAKTVWLAGKDDYPDIVLRKRGKRHQMWARTPERHPAPEKDGGFAFGVSGDGRSAVWLGMASKDWGVPGIFPRAVYTSAPAEDLRDVETLYLPSVERVPKRAFAGMPQLRTVHCRNSGQWIESEAFAECPSLNAIILGAAGETTIAGDAFSGCALDMTGVFFTNESSGQVAWRWLDCTDVWMRQVDIPMWGREFELIGMKVDLDRGKVEMPVIRFNGDSIEQEFEDGRIYEIYSDGSEGRRMAK